MLAENEVGSDVSDGCKHSEVKQLWIGMTKGHSRWLEYTEQIMPEELAAGRAV